MSQRRMAEVVNVERTVAGVGIEFWRIVAACMVAHALFVSLVVVLICLAILAGWALPVGTAVP